MFTNGKCLPLDHFGWFIFDTLIVCWSFLCNSIRCYNNLNGFKFDFSSVNYRNFLASFLIIFFVSIQSLQLLLLFL